MKIDAEVPSTPVDPQQPEEPPTRLPDGDDVPAAPIDPVPEQEPARVPDPTPEPELAGFAPRGGG